MIVTIIYHVLFHTDDENQLRTISIIIRPTAKINEKNSHFSSHLKT